MKLARLGPAGRERPVVIVDQVHYDLTPITSDIDGAFLASGGVDRARAALQDGTLAPIEQPESLRVGAPIARLGFPMAPRETELVLREAGALTVREMLLEAAVFDAAQMLNRGFLNRIVAVEQCAPEAMATAQRVATLAPAAARMNKQYIRGFHAQNDQSAPVEYASQAINSIANMTQQAYRYADSPEHREGIAAFVEKRKPVF